MHTTFQHNARVGYRALPTPVQPVAPGGLSAARFVDL